MTENLHAGGKEFIELLGVRERGATGGAASNMTDVCGR